MGDDIELPSDPKQALNGEFEPPMGLIQRSRNLNDANEYEILRGTGLLSHRKSLVKPFPEFYRKFTTDRYRSV